MARADDSETGALLDRSGERLVYLAAERTLLAWIRAAVTLIGLGFVIDRFALLVAERHPETAAGLAWAPGLGVGMLLAGVAVSAFGAVRYLRFVRAWERGEEDPGHGIRAAVVLAAGLAVFGAVLSVYLLRFSG